MKTYNICGMKIRVNKGTGEILKGLDDGSVDATYLSGAIAGIESLVLALACEGVDLNDAKIQSAVQTAVYAAVNNAGD